MSRQRKDLFIKLRMIESDFRAKNGQIPVIDFGPEKIWQETGVPHRGKLYRQQACQEGSRGGHDRRAALRESIERKHYQEQVTEKRGRRVTAVMSRVEPIHPSAMRNAYSRCDHEAITCDQKRAIRCNRVR